MGCGISQNICKPKLILEDNSEAFQQDLTCYTPKTKANSPNANYKTKLPETRGSFEYKVKGATYQIIVSNMRTPDASQVFA
ncbi:unnamed protein product [Blepharisma stoltei]|uniref:Uncharacterized protein n=1 Tax=Blepharisma stoltei TaxID=1481888 RepID=A0AAU9IJL8_9CILI|nr:unnamed protein product [Blepharisma stoltei]